MFNRLKQLLSSPKLRLLLVVAVILLLSGCGENPTAPEEENGYTSCWACGVYEAVFNAIDSFMEALMRLTTQWGVTLLGVGLLFWLLFYIGKFLVTIQEPNLRKFLFPITTVLFKAFVVYAMIHEADTYIAFVGDNFLQPILDFFVQFSKLVLDSNQMVQMETAVNLPAETGLNAEPSLLFGNVREGFLEIIYRLFSALKMGINLGFVIWTKMGFVTFIFGLFVICMFWWLLLIMPLSFTDALVRIATVVIISPLVLVAWVFPPTKKLIGKLWGVILGSGMTLLFSCFYVTLTTYIILLFAERTYPGILGPSRQASDPGLVNDITTLSSGSLAFFVLILALNKLSGYIPDLANQFGGESVRGSWVKAVNGLKKLSIATAKIAIGIAISNPSLVKQAANEVKDVAKDTAKSA